MFSEVYQNKSVWLSGGTGFKGAWLAEWLLLMGAKVRIFSLPPPTSPSLFEQVGLASRLEWHKGDIRDAKGVRESLFGCAPDFVFHLAAQPLVRLSYEQPVETYETNVLGTIHVMEALRTLRKPCAAVMVTTDKCYENREWVHGYREEDSLGGYDPYSSSKAAAEIAIASWRRSFFQGNPVRLASARAGNVIGGGDWALDRIVPDSIRALVAGNPIAVRSKTSVRPWQHVLEPLSGYLWLAAVLAKPELAHRAGEQSAGAFNFGPGHEANHTVADLVAEILKHWPGTWDDCSAPNAFHEASLLQLATDKANALLGWAPVWKFPEAVRETVRWYHAAVVGDPQKIQSLVISQIEGYHRAAMEQEAVWST